MSIGAIIRRIYLPTFEEGILPFLVIVQPFNMHPYIGNANLYYTPAPKKWVKCFTLVCRAVQP